VVRVSPTMYAEVETYVARAVRKGPRGRGG
jgi:hypothetical protein